MAVLKYGRRLCRLHLGYLRPARNGLGSHCPQTTAAKSHLWTRKQPLAIQWQQTFFSMSYLLPLTAVPLRNTMPRLHHAVMVTVWNSLSYRYLHDSAPLWGLPRRILPHGREKKNSKKKVKDKRVVLIDLNGTNLGEMDGEIAEKLAESKRADIVLESKQTEERGPVYKLVSLRKIREAKKLKDKKEKKDPRQITKEISVSTKIGAHDFKVKVTQMKDILTSLYNVRVIVVGTNILKLTENRTERLAEEMKKQSKMLKEIEADLKGFGVKVAEQNSKKHKLQCTFRSTVSGTASQDTIQTE